jgi:N-acetylmuramoyl-L-alanine amidase
VWPGNRPATDARDDVSGELFDADLDRAVRGFQQRRGLVADGVVGEETRTALDAARWRLGDRILLSTAHPMRGDDVAALQERLVVLGLFPSAVDGVFGPGTEAALREFQRGLGLRDDGMCGAVTLRAMRALARASGNGDAWALRQQARVAGSSRSLTGKTVVLDPGHGGSDPGVVAHGLSEAEVVFELALRIRDRLAQTGVTAVLTRDRDDHPSPRHRAACADEAGADIAVSLHCGGYPTAGPNGVATYFQAGPLVGSRSPVGEHLATLLQREIVVRTGMTDCRTHPCTFDVLTWASVPTARVEIGYLTHADDALRLGQPGFPDLLAEAVVVAVQRLYLGSDDRSTGTLSMTDVLATATAAGGGSPDPRGYPDPVGSG